MNTYMIIFDITSTLWVLSEVFLNRFLRSGKTDKKSADKNTELFIWLTIGVSVALGIYVSKMFACHIFPDERYTYIGIGIIYVGILIRLSAVRQLGKYFTVDVTIRRDHKIMQTGFYKYLRHPSYSGSLLSFIGFGLTTDNWVGFAIMFVPILLAFMRRMNVEEKVLTEQFGKDYTDYMSATKRVLPFVY